VLQLGLDEAATEHKKNIGCGRHPARATWLACFPLRSSVNMTVL
jgi:hypothetical protein